MLISELNDCALHPTTSINKDVPPVVLKVIDYLNTHYAEKISLSSIANKFYISKGSLIYSFNKFMDCSPIDYLLNIRLTKAKELLLNSKKNIGEISEACGFSSANYFSLIFKLFKHTDFTIRRKTHASKSSKLCLTFCIIYERLLYPKVKRIKTICVDLVKVNFIWRAMIIATKNYSTI